MVSPLSEQELIQRIAQGNEKAFATLYNQYQPKLHLFIYPLTGCSRQDTDEIIQDVFFKLWMRRDMLITIQSLQAYLFMMARNRLRDWHRSQQLQQQLVHTLTHQQPAQHEEVTENSHFKEYTRIARQAIALLSDQKRKIFAMRHEQDLSLDEIADALQITKFGVKKQLYDAVKFVKHYLKTNAGIDMPMILLLICCFPQLR